MIGILQFLQGFRQYLHPPGVVRLARQHGLHRILRAAAALNGDCREERLTRHAKVLVPLIRHDGSTRVLIELEVNDLVRACADRHQVRLPAFLCTSRSLAQTAFELGLLQYIFAAVKTDKLVVGVPNRVFEGNLQGQVVNRLHRPNGLGICIAVEVRDGTLVAPGEYGVMGRERGAVRPQNSGFQFPGDGGQVLRDAAVINGRNGCGQARNQAPILAVIRQRLQDESGGVQVLVRVCKVRVGRRWRLPIPQGQGFLLYAVSARDDKKSDQHGGHAEPAPTGFHHASLNS